MHATVDSTRIPSLMHAMRRVAVRACSFLLLAAAGCGGQTFASTSPRQCESDTDCAAGDSCLFSSYASCGTLGVCAPKAEAGACIDQVACGCTGGTATVCLVNGNSPSPIASLGSCDGASQQQPFDAGLVSANDAGFPTDDDASVGPQPEAAAPESGPPPVDASPDVAETSVADASVPSTLGSPCTSAAECTDPNYTLCVDVSTGSSAKCSVNPCVCSANCMGNQDCRPPQNGFCNFSSDPFSIDGYCDLQ